MSTKLAEALEAWSAQVADKEARRAPRGVVKTYPPHCRASQMSDRMVCRMCGLSYDVNDPEPPVCPQTGQPARASGSSRP